MKQISVRTPKLVRLLLVAVVVLLAGCGQGATVEPAGSAASYRSALSTAYEGALDVTSQLALGTLALEDTAQAVTEEQAATLLPLWHVLQGGELEGNSERDAVLTLIEASMSGEQIATIAAMQLTQGDVQAWAQNEDSTASVPVPDASAPVPDGNVVPASMPQGMSEEQLVKMRDQSADMSDEDRTAQRAQFSGSGSPAGGGSQGLLSAVVDLLSAQSGTVADAVTPSDSEAVPSSEPLTVEPPASDEVSSEPAAKEPSVEAVVAQPAADTATGSGSETLSAQPAQAVPSANVRYVVRAGNTLAAIAQAYGVTVEAIVAANEIPDPNAIHVGQELIIPDPALVPEAVGGSTEDGTATVMAAAVPALEWLADDDPGPPLTIEVSANMATQDSLVERSQTYLVTGIVRNDGEQTYAVSDILVTFYDAEGFRGTFTPAIRDGVLVGGEWHWHGETEAEFAALLLAPGEEWPFRIEITAQDMASFLIHPDAAPTERESAPIALSDVTLVDEGTGYLRISGTATNGNPFAVKNVTVSGVLLDANGQIVSVGSVYVLQEDIAPGESTHFCLRVEKEPYVSYQLYAQAERDWN